MTPDHPPTGLPPDARCVYCGNQVEPGQGFITSATTVDTSDGPAGTRTFMHRACSDEIFALTRWSR